MILNPHLQRAGMLVQQRRYEQAQQEVGRALGDNPDDGAAHALLALCQSEQDLHQKAADSAKQALALSPSDPEVWTMAAHVALKRNDLDECERLANGATALAPFDARPYVTRASVLAHKKRWKECLAAAEQALAIDPDHTSALNLRSLANRGLGRSEGYAGDIQQALRSNPEDSYTHANAGWACLEQGDAKGAQTHFREAIRLDPTNETARIGVLETTKAAFPFYRWFLGLMLKLHKLPAKYQIGLLVGMWVLMQFLLRLADMSPILALVAVPIVLVYMCFCVATWFWQPISNAALMLHPFARLALTRGEKFAAGVVTLIFCLMGGLFLGGMLTKSELCLSLFLSSAPTCIAVAFACQFDDPKPRKWLLWMAAGFLAVNGWYQVCLIGGETFQNAVPGFVMRLTAGPLMTLRNWGPLIVIVAVNFLSAQNWKK